VTPPLCIDCKWMGKDTNDGTPICRRPGVGQRNNVTGGMLYPRCDDQRQETDWFIDIFCGKHCRINARYFTPK